MTIFKKSISNKLKNLLLDSLSEEDRIAQHFTKYANSLVRTSHHNEAISLQILQTGEELSIKLFQGNKPIKIIPLDEVALFFTDGFTASLIGKSIVEEKLKNYFRTFEDPSPLKSIGVRMVILKKENVKIYTIGMQNTSEVLLSEFITFFKS
ncbi:hypothetical protein ACFO3O_08035 [Dokdonia ponticola]|uniref:Uncharacterized protein n=1 Tax=Dokdonia ponticola TaxID=2041041 RepID=A0ABV9HVK8_9FLAO